MKENNALIIGAGVTGLTAAYHLLNYGWRVSVVEASELLGGLAASIELNNVPIEKYYHFICREDHELVALIDELGLSPKLSWKEASTGFFIDGQFFPFNTPRELLKFSSMPIAQRIRFGLHVLLSQFRNNWESLDKIAAKPWLIRNIGQQAYNAIWDPLLRIKFGKVHDQISAAWIWHRIHRVAKSRSSMFAMNSYGFLERGCHDLIERLAYTLSRSPRFTMLTNSMVKNIAIDGNVTKGITLTSGKFMPSDLVLSTCAIPDFLKLIDIKNKYVERLASIDYLNIVCMLMVLDRPFTDNFWLNVNDPRIKFNGVVEITNLNPRHDFKSSRIIYIPFYLNASDPRWLFSDEQLFGEYSTALSLIRPDFDKKWIKDWRVYRNWHAQAVCRVGFKDIMPGYETPLSNLFITDSSQYYPEDRTLSASVRLGRQVAELINSKG